jgi:hypothetical protein
MSYPLKTVNASTNANGSEVLCWVQMGMGTSRTPIHKSYGLNGLPPTLESSELNRLDYLLADPPSSMEHAAGSGASAGNEVNSQFESRVDPTPKILPAGASCTMATILRFWRFAFPVLTLTSFENVPLPPITPT